MKVTKIVYEQKRNDGNYGSVSASVEIQLTAKDTTKKAWTLARKECEAQIDARLKEAADEPRIGGTTTQHKSATAPTKTSVSVIPAKPKTLKGEALEKFKEENAEAVYKKAVDIFGEDDAVNNMNAAAAIIARELGVTGMSGKKIGTLTLTDTKFDLKCKVVSIGEPQPYTKQGGGEGSRIQIIFEDDTGQISATLFDGQQKLLEHFAVNDEIVLQQIFKVTEFRDKPQLNLGNYAKVLMIKKAPITEQEYIL